MQLLTPKQLRKNLFMTKKQYELYFNEGMPHLVLAGEIRFEKDKVVQWLQTFFMQQETLEKNFVDENGRTINDYITLSQLKERLQLKKNMILSLCKEGLPYATIGEKRFFHLEDVLAYFVPQTAPITKNSIENNAVTIIVDGSYSHETSEICTGMVVQTKAGMQGFSKLHPIRTKSPIHSEFLALYEALLYAKKQPFEEVIVGTDQLSFITFFNQKEKGYLKWMKEVVFKEITHDMYRIIEEMGERLTLVYANTSEYQTLYKNAHALSRRYETTVVEKIDYDKPLPAKKVLNRAAVTNENALPPIEQAMNAEDTIRIKFVSAKKDYVYFNVHIGGQTKQTKMLNTTPTRAAILLAYSYVKDTKKKLTMIIENMPSFEKDMQVISSKANAGRTYEIIETLYEKSHFNPKNDFAMYLDKMKEKRVIA